MQASVEVVSALSDNYIYLIDTASGVIVVDPAEAAPAQEALAGRTILALFNTHHHGDHTGGNEALHAPGVPLIAPEDPRIPHVDKAVREGDTIEMGKLSFEIIEVPGHTSTHIAFYESRMSWLFSGDSLFAGGCGRLFEGTPAQMWASLLKLRRLPSNTLVFSGHEYTLSNLRFALSLEPKRPPIAERLKKVEALREAGKASIPSTLAEEKATNPFLRADDPELKRALNMEGANADEVFAHIRTLKDRF